MLSVSGSRGVKDTTVIEFVVYIDEGCHKKNAN